MTTEKFDCVCTQICDKSNFKLTFFSNFYSLMLFKLLNPELTNYNIIIYNALCTFISTCKPQAVFEHKN